MTSTQQVLDLLKVESDKIEQLIQVQKNHLNLPECPVYIDVVDTQMYGLSRIIDFIVRLDLISAEQGKEILNDLERRLL